jgi:hypothetical protein
VPGLSEVVAGSDWTYGASILTFVFPELLFVAVAGALYVLYTKPHLVPGHRYQMQLRSAVDTVAPAVPGGAGRPAGPTAVDTSAINEQPPGGGAEG